MKYLRALGRMAATGILAATLIPAQILVAGPVFKNRDFIPGLLFRSLRGILGLSVEFNGAAAIRRDRPIMHMANHISFLDPLILSEISDKSGFVAMKSIREWPLLGKFAESMGTVFASNGKSAKDLPDIHDQLTGMLNEGRDITFCPEGTVRDGLTVVPFKTGIISVGFNSLASKKLTTDIGYQSFALHFKRIDGKDPRENPTLRKIYVRDEEANILKQLWDILCVKSVEAELTVLEDLDPKDFRDAKHLAEVSRNQIISSLEEKGLRPR